MYDSKPLNLKLNPRNVPTTLALSLTLIGLLLWTTHSASYNPLGLGFWDRSDRGMDADYSDIRVGVYEGSGFHDGKLRPPRNISSYICSSRYGTLALCWAMKALVWFPLGNSMNMNMNGELRADE
jgi:hypothetical protein